MEIRNASDMMSQAESVGQGCRVTQLFPGGSADNAMLAVDLWEIEPGGFTPLSAHAEEHVMFVLSGTGEISGAVAGGPTVMLRKDTVMHIGHREVHALRNTGSELLRVLVSTPLLVRSDRALGYRAHHHPVIGAAETADSPSATPQLAPQPTRASRIAESSPPAEVSIQETAPASDSQPVPASNSVDGQEPPAPDISGLVKRASEVAATPKSERRKPPPPPEPEPESAVQQDENQVAEEEEEEEAPSNLMELLVVFDGGSRGNPGQGYGSYMVQTPNRKPVIRRSEFGDNYTNNQAEYDTLIEALGYIIERLEATNRSPKQVQLDIRTDSDLVVNQLLGTYKVKDAGLRTRNAKAHELLERFGEWVITWHPREESVRLLGH